MNTLIKWPGGKKNEIKYIKDLIPEHDNYVEPFFGGGALFFELEPKKAYINDASSELVQFYSILADNEKSEILKKYLMEYDKYWNSYPKIMEETSENLMNMYNDFKLNKIDTTALKEALIHFMEKNENSFLNHYPKNKTLFKDFYKNEIIKNLNTKFKRTKKLDLTHNFSTEEVKANIETALRSSFYMHERYIMNQISTKGLKVSEEEDTANFYFVREYCYGSMFRYNKKGEFNIPYGGMSYNKKDFGSKIKLLFSSNTKKILQNTKIENLDFEEFLNKYEFTEKDFMFFDPPYDTEFSTYALNSFTLDDQKRLADCLLNLKANFILIIKNTDFIWDLYYGKEGIQVETFQKNYSYNMRGRNERKVEHLIIHNITNPQSKIDNF